jgi:hypothetical protein
VIKTDMEQINKDNGTDNHTRASWNRQTRTVEHINTNNGRPVGLYTMITLITEP